MAMLGAPSVAPPAVLAACSSDAAENKLVLKQQPISSIKAAIPISGFFGHTLDCSFKKVSHAVQSICHSHRPYTACEIAVDGLVKSEFLDLAPPIANIQEPEELAKRLGQASANLKETSSFIAEVKQLIKLVDSKDIVELELKNKDYEILIRKREAVPLPAHDNSMHHHVLGHTSFPAFAMSSVSVPSIAPVNVPPPEPVAPTPVSAPVSAPVPEFPPMLSPMAGTFYRCAAPGEPPFVKVGDRIQKGQVVCIIEAMKLMNEIEADQSGTVVEIVAEDGKPISMEAPLFVIQP